jgi:mediator of RNA polymerase II transcription subunit 10
LKAEYDIISARCITDEPLHSSISLPFVRSNLKASTRHNRLPRNHGAQSPRVHRRHASPPFVASLTPAETLKKTIHSLYTLQSSTHGYLGPETATALASEIRTLSSLLTTLHSQTQPPNSTSPPLAEAQLPPEIIEYVDAARNPDIYIREFVELVQRGNSYLKGKGEGLASLRDKLASEMVREWPDLEAEVRRVVPEEVKREEK